MKKLLILGSIAAPCPPKKQGGTERVAYYQAKQLAKNGIPSVFIGGVGTTKNFLDELKMEGENVEDIFHQIDFVEIGGGTQYGTAEDAQDHDPSLVEASRNMRRELVFMALVQQYMYDKKSEYDVVLNNLRGASPLLQTAHTLGKTWINVMHLNIFPELADLFKKYRAKIITIADHQRKEFPDLDYLATVYNPIDTSTFQFNETPNDYALMLGTIGYHKNQKDAILAAKKARIPLILAGKIRDQDYFDNEIKPHIENDKVQYIGELNFETKMRLYKEASVFLFPIKWQEPFGLVVIEALACGTPVIAYPHGGPTEIVQNGKNGYLVNSVDEMAIKIKEISQISRKYCRDDVKRRFDEDVIGKKYVDVVKDIYNTGYN